MVVKHTLRRGLPWGQGGAESWLCGQLWGESPSERTTPEVRRKENDTLCLTFTRFAVATVCRQVGRGTNEGTSRVLWRPPGERPGRRGPGWGAGRQ